MYLRFYMVCFSCVYVSRLAGGRMCWISFCFTMSVITDPRTIYNVTLIKESFVDRFFSVLLAIGM